MATSKKSRSGARKKPTGRSTARGSAPRSGGVRSRAVRPKVKSEEQMARDKEIAGIILIAVALMLLINFMLAPSSTAVDLNAIGVVSLFFIRALRFIAGGGAVALPIFLLAFGIMVCADRNRRSAGRSIGMLLIFIAFLGFLQLEQDLLPFKEYLSVAAAGLGGGIVGSLLTFSLLKTVGQVGAVIFYSALMLIGILLALQTSLSALFHAVKSSCLKLFELVSFSNKQENRPQVTAEMENTARLQKVPIISHDAAAPMITPPEEMTATATPPPPETPFMREYMPSIGDSCAPSAGEPPEIGERPQVEIHHHSEQSAVPHQTAAAAATPRSKPRPADAAQPAPLAAQAAVPAVEESGRQYALPAIDLVQAGIKVRNPRLNKAITENIGILESTLDSFGVKATVTQVVAGPSVTRYELQPAPGIKVSRITSLSDDIALTLAAQAVRIEAPIPGKSAIGIEVARKERDVVYFREMIESEEFQNGKSKLSFALGKNIGGEAIIGDLTKMPHLLIAGSTGSGKSVCINTIICSLLYKARPDEVKLMLIDPKQVEMMNYAQLPHLIAPVVNDSKKASNALKWAVNEMENRYSLFVGAMARDFDGYNIARPEEKLPYIVIVIDELADLMMVARHEVEDSIIRLAQKARAAGIHLVVATQRPSVDVITGLIKANIPSRIAFAVSSYTDSRTIIDTGGAEKLLGNGDMLYAPIGRNKPERVQGSFINEKDVKHLVEYCANQADPHYSEEAVNAAVHGEKVNGSGGHEEDGDELLYDAAALIISTGQASTSFLQRRLAIGNPRAARLMDMLEAKGIVGGPKGSKPRDILITMEELEDMYG